MISDIWRWHCDQPEYVLVGLLISLFFLVPRALKGS